MPNEKEYVFRIATRDPAHPLAETVLLEFGCAKPGQLIEALDQLTNLLEVLGTPEKVAAFMVRNNQAAAIVDRLRAVLPCEVVCCK